MAATACERSPATQIAERVRTAASWSAAAQMTADAWLAGSVPDQYASSSLAMAHGQLDALATISARGTTAAPSPDSLDAIIARAARAAAALQRAVDRQQRDSTSGALASLRTIHARLTQLHDSLGRRSVPQ